jgi:type II secretion system protein N
MPSTSDNNVAASELNAAVLEPAWRRWTPSFSVRFGWGLYTAICFAIFLFLTLPADILLQRVIITTTRGTPLHVRYELGELTWSGAVVMRDMTIEQRETNLPALKVTRLVVRPSWLSLLFGQLFPLTFQADLYGGAINGMVEQGQKGCKVTLTAQHLNLALLPIPTTGQPGGLKGLLTGNGELSGDLSQIFSLQGALELNVSEGSLQAGALGKLPVPPLQSMHGNLRANIRDGRVNIADFTLAGDGVEVRTQGTLTLSTPLPYSGLELQLAAKTVGSPPPTLTALLSLLPASPHTPGERRAMISGSLAAPVMR